MESRHWLIDLSHLNIVIMRWFVHGCFIRKGAQSQLLASLEKVDCLGQTADLSVTNLDKPSGLERLCLPPFVLCVYPNPAKRSTSVTLQLLHTAYDQSETLLSMRQTLVFKCTNNIWVLRMSTNLTCHLSIWLLHGLHLEQVTLSHCNTGNSSSACVHVKCIYEHNACKNWHISHATTMAMRLVAAFCCFEVCNVHVCFEIIQLL